MKLSPSLVMADAAGNITDDPDLLMLSNRAGHWRLPEAEDLTPLPPESELFLLPGRRAVGLNPKTGQIIKCEEWAVAAFASPGYTFSSHPAYLEDSDAPVLPLFAYGAVGYSHGKFWISASKVDEDRRQIFRNIKPGRLERESKNLLNKYPKNRLISHIINNCVRRYACPAGRNFALGRYEAPLPTAQACNARCLGCISLQAADSQISVTPQCRMSFTPKAAEIAEVMAIHEKRERKTPIYSFGQGCEGDPLMNADLLCESIARFRALSKKGGGGGGTINCNSNASRPEVIADLAKAGLTSLRASINSARPEIYAAYYRPQGYEFKDVAESLRNCRLNGIHTALNLLYFPGLTDTWPEVEALAALCRDCGVSMIQLRNLNIDPVWYLKQLNLPQEDPDNQPLGLRRFMKLLHKSCPWLRFGYFNPWLGAKAEIGAPMPE